VIHELLGYENVAIALLERGGDADGRGDVLVLRHFGGAYKRAIGGAHRMPVSRGLMGAAARTREVVLVNEASADPRYLPTPRPPSPRGGRRGRRTPSGRSCGRCWSRCAG
jgi:hypothetical protein